MWRMLYGVYEKPPFLLPPLVESTLFLFKLYSHPLESVSVTTATIGLCLTDDYLHDDLSIFSQEALTYNRSWLLVKPVGTELWIGPLFRPGKTGCWACLAHRLRGARKIESYLQEKTGSSAPRTVPLAMLPSTFHTALSIAATETAKWIGCGQNETLEGRIVTFDTLSLTTQSHTLVQRPQCPCCGDPHAFAANSLRHLCYKAAERFLRTIVDITALHQKKR